MDAPQQQPVMQLHPGPVDVIGDVHGEFEALTTLLGHLGYDGDGRHPDDRCAVFIGDLCDRGPDSPAVLDLVMRWVQSGRAQCVIGNHELNVLLGAPKHGNGWFFDRDHDVHKGEFLQSRAATEEKRRDWGAFLGRLPLALAREDLRIVHACWHAESIHVLAKAPTDVRWPALHAHFHEQAKRFLRDSGADHRAAQEIEVWRHAFEERNAVLPMLPAIAEVATVEQNRNPLKVLTSGLESPASTPGWASGKWRMTSRSRWWRDYRDTVPVIIGHYWRRDARARPEDVTGDWDYCFDDSGPYDWLGPHHNVYCVDYSVGKRYEERTRGVTSAFSARLAAMRWPERELVFDDGERQPTNSGP